jgi:hypothetical protein
VQGIISSIEKNPPGAYKSSRRISSKEAPGFGETWRQEQI